MQIKSIDSMDNDWYEYIQYGTNNNIIIALKKIGFSRENALKIFNKNYYTILNDNDILINKEIFQDENENLVEEAEEVKLNNIDKFILN